jgi:hypothetical protein
MTKTPRVDSNDSDGYLVNPHLSLGLGWPHGVVHGQQVHKKIVGQGFFFLAEGAEFRPAVVHPKYAQASDQHRHFRCGQGQQVGTVDKHFLAGAAVGPAHVVTEAIGAGL